eukprot:8594476-Prorocentrum_lima.AAC.1
MDWRHFQAVLKDAGDACFPWRTALIQNEGSMEDLTAVTKQIRSAQRRDKRQHQDNGGDGYQRQMARPKS